MTYEGYGDVVTPMALEVCRGFGVGPIEVGPGLEDRFIRTGERMPLEKGALVFADDGVDEVVVGREVGRGSYLRGSAGSWGLGRRDGELFDGEDAVGEDDLLDFFGVAFLG